MGSIVVMKKFEEGSKYSETTLVHELNHTKQCMRLGIFQPILYGLSYLAIKIGCSESDPYYSNPFEVDSRRVAGQVIDVEGYVRKLQAQKDQKSTSGTSTLGS